MKARLSIAALVACGPLAWASEAKADTTLFEEDLSDGACEASACDDVSGGQFVAEGFRIDSAESRIVFDMGQSVACGTLEVEITQFDPIASGHTGEYVNIVGVYEGNHGNNWTAADNDEAQLQVSGNCDRCLGTPIPDAWRDERMKFKALACSWDYQECGGFPDGNRYLPEQNAQGINWGADTSKHWTIKTTWDCTGTHDELTDGVASWTDDGQWSYHAGYAEPQPHLRYVFVGRDFSGDQTAYLDGMVVVRVKAVQLDACNCPATPLPGDAGTDGSSGSAGSAGTAGSAGSGGGAGNAGAGGGAGAGGAPPDAAADDGSSGADAGAQGGSPAASNGADDSGCSCGVIAGASSPWTALAITFGSACVAARRRKRTAA